MPTNCLHKPNHVTADILQGDCPGKQVQWCRECGAVRVKVFEGKHFDTEKYTSPWTTPLTTELEYPLNVSGLSELAKEWAKDDRLWTTQETVAFNLETFGRCVLGLKHQ